MTRIMLIVAVLSLAAPASALTPGKPVDIRCAEDWKAGPVNVYGSYGTRHQFEVEVPPACAGKRIRYHFTGRAAAQAARCDAQVRYGSGGSSPRVEAFVSGMDEQAGEVPSVLSETERLVRVRCLSGDDDRPLNVRACVSCTPDTSAEDLFMRELQEFKSQ
ncbi:hypothetical protein dsat_2395 [Alkalidesulfovibrio alkalitolerans DSM 16529]|jgi:hypothetical protein|uniref:Uncharacterized protein n=1 Tax=Alkalidesulfovibrio alkalitolerans DSM 16529 TaxID=1121439 RepID=S7TCU1_9BACT|nr:hypothetical protein [Alkalidesulfovibrio alkalitolerans]EPR35032.1 hypothetical protein dsat_2395 [Alkalidesulfovibrio alkalitolerans DSM 16529]